MQNVRRNFVLPMDLDLDLNSISKKIGDSKSKIVVEALERYFDYLDLQVAKERATKFESGEHKGITPKELREKLGLNV